MLGYHGLAKLSKDHRDRLYEIITSLIQLDLNERVIQQSIQLRQHRKMGLADAIIAATALANGLALVTRNVDDFANVATLKVINPFTAE